VEAFMTIEENVKSIIAKQLRVDAHEVRPEASFIEDLGADSLDIVQLVMALEEEFQIDIPDEDVENLRTVQDVINYIKKHAVQ
jgi:acyl carrier protein